jgi:hypothetical protein
VMKTPQKGSSFPCDVEDFSNDLFWFTANPVAERQKRRGHQHRRQIVETCNLHKYEGDSYDSSSKDFAIASDASPQRLMIIR